MDRIVVCVKAVPEPEKVKVDPETHTLKREGTELILNPFDEPAVEMALRLKEKYSAEVIAISMGPPNAEGVLKRVYSMGIDKLILLCDRVFAGADTLATSYTLAGALKKLSPFSIVLMGIRSLDGSTSQVPPETASILQVPSIINVKEIYKEAGNWIVIRDTDYGEEEIEVSPPVVISMSPHIDYIRPRSLKRVLKLKEVKAEVWNAETLSLEKEKLGLNGSPTRVTDVYEKKIELKGKIYQGEPAELVEKFIEILKEKGILRG